MNASRQNRTGAIVEQPADIATFHEDPQLVGNPHLVVQAPHPPGGGTRPQDIVAMHLRELPFLDRGADGEVRNGFTIDYWYYAGDNLLISGWVVGEQLAELIKTNRASPGAKVRLFPRPDVESTFPALRASSRGMLAIIPATEQTFQLFGLHLWLPPRSPNDGERIWLDHGARLGFLLEHCSKATQHLTGVLAQLPRVEANPKARAHIEHAKGVAGHGGLVVGWAITLPGVKLALLDSSGHLQFLTKPIRWHRPDIVDAFGFQFGNFTFNAGLLQAWHHPLEIGQELHLIALDGDACHVLASVNWEAAPVEPTSFARWAFEFPTPLDQFFDRLDEHDGAIIKSLIANKMEARPTTSPEIVALGHPVDNPNCSIIVPLYGRFDFMLNQLLEFSEDEQLKKDAEIIYVVDDPRIVSDVKQQSWLLYEFNRVPFKIVYAGENRGFSGANNLGVSVSRAPFLLLLNSDVIPVEAGWLDKMISAFDKEGNVGIVGARLLYPNGSIQHDGMSFVWHPELNSHVNKHPGIGLEPPIPRGRPTPRVAVTGACLMMRKSTYLNVGGFDESFLIGDFEDSDLCLKVRETGKAILCVEDVNLIHLERQSLVGIGQSRYRDLVVRYNAWQHETRWGAVLRKIAEGAAT
jgi:GT2 family glycosyltransferase